jgi:putative hemolysin
VPKRIAMQRAEAVTRLAAPPLGVFARAMTPVIWLLSVSTNAVVSLLGGDPQARTAAVSAEEVRAMVAGSEELSEHHRKILGDVFDAADRTVAEVMRPRGQVDFLAADTPAAEALAAAAGLTHSRYPVFRADRDDVVGFVHLRDLLRARDGASVGSLARPLIAFPGSVTVLAALARLRGEAQQLGLVVDEYGGTDGIVALEDLLEEIVGEIYDEYDLGVPPAGRIVDASGAVLVDGSLIVQELPEVAGIEVPDDGSYETVGGYILAALGRIAAPGDTVDGPGYRIEVTAVDGLRIARVRIVTEPFPDAGQPGR